MTHEEVRLRRVDSPGDLDLAGRLAREFGNWATEKARLELGIVIPPEEDHRVEVLSEVLDSGGRLYVAELEGAAVGVGGLKLLEKSVGELKRMFVRPTARGRGVGRALLRRLVDDARELGCTTIYLESASFMDGAHALYRSAGFVSCESYPGREFEGAAHDISVFMRLDLA